MIIVITIIIIIRANDDGNNDAIRQSSFMASLIDTSAARLAARPARLDRLGHRRVAGWGGRVSGQRWWRRAMQDDERWAGDSCDRPDSVPLGRDADA